MRLRSDFHDYYDNALGYGIDDSIFYSRYTKEVDIEIRTSLNWPTDFFAGVVGFCGRIYPFAEVLRHVESSTPSITEYEVVETYYAYSPEEYERMASAWRDRGGWFNCTDGLRWRKLKQFFRDWSFESDRIFLEHKVPVWIVPRVRQNSTGFINPRLQSFGFERVKDSNTAYQDISVYLGSTLAELERPKDIADKFKIEQHGFDLKTSFRRPKKKN